MHSQDYFRQKALRQYEAFLLAWLKDDSFFPLRLSAGKVDLKNFSQYQEELDILNNHSKEARGYGYVIESETRRTRRSGEQTIPHHIVFETDGDYLRYLSSHKLREFKHFMTDVAMIRSQQPGLAAWLEENVKEVINYHGEWDSLLKVCQYFIAHPRPQRYIRELPIEIHTKFIETHTGILDKLLQVLLPPSAYDAGASNFNARYGIRDKSSLIRIRFLDETMQSETSIPFHEFAIPINTFARMTLSVDHCIIVENELNFLTLPPVSRSIAIWGAGFKVGILRDVHWLNDVDILYWGDIDVQGFQILSNLRRHFSHIRSILMNQDTLATFEHHALKGTETKIKSVPNLTMEERKIYQHILANNLRLEQEHISQNYVNQVFESM